MSADAADCRVCSAPAAPWFADGQRRYARCAECGYLQLAAGHWLSVAAERQYYGTHQNEVDDPRYRAWLGRLAVPLMDRLEAPASGLDFGCGPAPALAAMLSEAGFAVALHDPLFFPDESVFDRSWDFVTATEVFEHLRQPAVELERLWDCLAPGGWLGVMTRRPPDDPATFADWHYRRDPTHIGFFAAKTFAWLASRWDARLELLEDDVALLRKPRAQSRNSLNT